MTTDSTPEEQAARLARLAARRSPAATPDPVIALVAARAGNPAPPAPKSRRSHAAAAGRVLATGVATTGFLGVVGALAQADNAAGSGGVNTPASQDTVVVVHTIHHVIYVDEAGNTIPAPGTPDTAGDLTTLPPATTVPVATTIAGPAPVVPPTTAAPKGAATTAPRAPATTAPRAPATTAAPAPPTTAKPKPPPTTQPPPPACTGSKCP